MDKKGLEVKDSNRIFYHQAGRAIFYTDFLSICGNSLFQMINPLVKYLHMFKLFRILSLHKIIINSNATENQKVYAIIFKLLLYLILWFHILACGWWIVVGWDANLEYLKEREGVIGHDYCVYARHGVVYNTTGTTTPFPCDERDSMWLPGPTYAENEWIRYTDTDRPFGYAWFTSGALPWNEMNAYWEETPMGWIAPMNMANWPDQVLYTN